MMKQQNPLDCKENWQTILNGKEECFEYKASANENGKSIRFNNPSKKDILRIKVDNCLITSSLINKCDYVFVVCEDEAVHFVELKGNAERLQKPYDQIVSTIEHFEKHKQTPKNKRFGYIVGANVPRGGNALNDLKDDFKKKYGKNLERKSEFAEVNI